MPETTKWFCVDCEKFGKGCEGLLETAPFTNCVLREHWLNTGRKVASKSKPDRIGEIVGYMWAHQQYVVSFPRPDQSPIILPFSGSELLPKS